MDSIENRIKEGMKKCNLTPSELADKSGLSRGTISKYINGRMQPKYGAIVAMSKVLGVTPAWLLGFDEENEEPEEFDFIEKQVVLEVRKLSPDGQLKVKNFVKFLLFEEGIGDGDPEV